MKRKTLNGNPRLAPISGSNNGKFGFSVNGTRRLRSQGRETNLAPGAQTGPQQMIGSTPSLPTGPGIYGHRSAVCTNEDTVVKTSVINTRGMLSRRLRGIERQVPVAPIRSTITKNLKGNTLSACGCETGKIQVPAYNIGTQYFPSCEKNNTQYCIGPLSVNWVKGNSNGTGALEYSASEFTRKKKITSSPPACLKFFDDGNSLDLLSTAKSVIGIPGVLGGDVFAAANKTTPQGKYFSTYKVPKNVFNNFIENGKIMPTTSKCTLLKLKNQVLKTENQQPIEGKLWKSSKQNKNCNIVKPGIVTVDYNSTGVPNSVSSILFRRVLCTVAYKGANTPLPEPNIGNKPCKNAINILEPIKNESFEAFEQSLRGNLWPWNQNIAPGLQVATVIGATSFSEIENGLPLKVAYITLSKKNTSGGKSIPPFLPRNPYKFHSRDSLFAPLIFNL